MSVKVLIAHAKGEASEAEKLAGPIRAAGYDVAHEGTVLVGESVIGEANRLLLEGCPVVVCGTVRAMGTGWARRYVQAARVHTGVRVFIVQMEEEADTATISFDETIAQYWQAPAKAERALIAALNKYFPPQADAVQVLKTLDLESRYRALALKACDIVDLANLPEDDRHLASRELELRRLYVALRLRLEVRADDDAGDQTLLALESQRLARWDGQDQQRDQGAHRVSVGERLAAARRLVVLGDPGAGKSTLLRWLATAYLLRLHADADWQALPDIASLPHTNWLPILIRCRDLPPGAVTLDAMLQHSLRKSELVDADCNALQKLLREKLERGEALLLIDGLDEITDPGARARFAEQIEAIHRAVPDAPVVATSRIVGYREMGHRIRAGFEHLTVTDLSHEDKDDFSRRWCALTELPERREAATAELIRDIHSNERIERLTGNPMLLTTMALIKRKIGRLPQRRVDLYEKAVEVLLNWRSAVDAALDTREALPQLEYLAHAMCTDGIQQLREDQVLDLLRQCRTDYPNIHALTQHSPEAFLRLLEQRTGLLMQSGHTRHQGLSTPLYEFRHLTLQEYLAGLALVQGHYRGRDPRLSLAAVIAPLAGQHRKSGRWGTREVAVVASWREALRLCLALSPDDQVDDALRAVLHPLPGEQGTARPRAVQAALCLADEPNSGPDVANEIIRALVASICELDDGNPKSSLDLAVSALAASRWAHATREALLDDFVRCRSSPERRYSGGILAGLQPQQILEGQDLAALTNGALRLAQCEEREAIRISLAVVQLAFERKDCQATGLADGLIRWLSAGPAAKIAAAWALGWMTHRTRHESKTYVILNPPQLASVLAAAARPDCDSEALRYMCWVFATHLSIEAVPALLQHLPQQPSKVQAEILRTLGEIGEATGLAAIPPFLKHDDENVRRTTLRALAQTCTAPIDRRLLHKHFDEHFDGLDPAAPITDEDVNKAVATTRLSESKIRQRYEDLASRFGLQLAWTTGEADRPAASKGAGLQNT